MLDNWQRLEKVISWTGLSVNAFARNIGLKRAENLYQIKKGNHGISKELAEMVTAKYSGINKSWLLTGSGEMFLDEGQNANSSIPYYKTDIVKLISSKDYLTPSGYFSMPIFGNCDFAAFYLSDAMEPDLPYGSVVVVRKTPKEKLLPGKTYMVDSVNFCGVRIVRREPGSTQLRLVPRKKEDYDEMLVSIDDVTMLYEIAGYIVTK